MVPFNAITLMEMCSSYKGLSVDQRRACLDAMKKLAPTMVRNGELAESELQQAVGDKLVLSSLVPPRKDGKKQRLTREQMVLNRRRAVLASWPGILAAWVKPRPRGKRKAPVHEAEEVSTHN